MRYALGLMWLAVLASLARAKDPEVIVESPAATGLLVLEVVKDSQASERGFQVGDILTAYDGTAVKDVKEFVKLVSDNQKDAVDVSLVRDGRAMTIRVAKGKLGLKMLSVEKGKVARLLPPATAGFAFDLAALEKGPQETWRSFFIDGKKVGFEYQRLEKKGETLTHVTEVAFKSEKWGLQHFEVSSEARIAARGMPTLLSSRFRTPEMTAEGKQSGDGWLSKVMVEGKEENVRAKFGPDYFSDYLAAELVGFMPTAVGTCVHYLVFEVTEAKVLQRNALVVRGEEDVAIDGKKQKLLRIDTICDSHVMRTAWLDERGQIVKHFYGENTEAFATTREAATKQLPAGVEPLFAAKDAMKTNVATRPSTK